MYVYTRLISKFKGMKQYQDSTQESCYFYMFLHDRKQHGLQDCEIMDIYWQI